jgi:spore coat polysaccharide biosynthesis protein SpsF (cytidylyltransferase family)/sialic acid synthase SpsE
MKNIYNILEIANTHSGSVEYIYALLREFEEFHKKDKFGIKFQPFKYNKIATKEYEWYSVYKELYINKSQWNEILEKACETKDVWIDIFDEYSVEIIKNNLNKIYGLKLQTSILDNNDVYQALKLLDISNLKLIINIAGRDKDNIDKVLEQYQQLGSKKILLEVGFQSYPTKLIDSGLSKIKYLQKKYTHPIVFADHIDGNSQDAITLPLVASMLGVDYIEKHIMHSQLETKYDHFSSLKYDTYKKFIAEQNKYLALTGESFINQAEKEYFDNSYQIPVFKTNKEKLSLIDLNNDFKFRRSNLTGLDINDIKDLVNNYSVLNTHKKQDETLKKEDFKQANIAAIVACRLKSSRLKKKAILKIGDMTSIELCIKNALKIRNIHHMVLATSDNNQDSELRHYTYNKSTVFHQGSADNVVSRYIGIIDKLKIDVFIRITGDMPYVSSDIADYLLKKHFECGAEYTVASEFSVGTSVEIINSSALRRVHQYFPNANYSEYMTWYFQNNPEYFKLNFVDLPKKWIKDYRLTLDYQEDLDMFNHIEKYFKETFF